MLKNKLTYTRFRFFEHIETMYDIKCLLSKLVYAGTQNADGTGPATLLKRKGEERERAKFES